MSAIDRVELSERSVSPDRTSVPEISELIRAEGAFVLRMVRRLGVRECDVDDVAQEVFVVLHRRQADYRPEIAARSWIFGIVRRTVANYLRRAHLRHEVPTELEPESSAELADEALQRGRDRALLERALSALDLDKREVFVLFELEGMDMRDVAALVGCPLKTAYSRLYAARETVRSVVLRERQSEVAR